MTTHGKTKIQRKDDDVYRRITVAIPLRTTVFLDMISRYACIAKADLYATVWDNGFEATFGITQTDLIACDFAPPPHTAAIPKDDLRALTDLLCGEQ